jgi:hypothetical protein
MASSSLFVHAYHSFYAGIELLKLKKMIAINNKLIEKIKQRAFHLDIIWQVISNLIGESKNPIIISGNICDEKQKIKQFLKKNNRTAICAIYNYKLMLSYLFEDYDQAVINANCSKPHLISILASAHVPIFHFYDSLAHLAIFPNSSKTKQISILVRVFKNQRKMKKWAYHAPMNYLHKWQLVEAGTGKSFWQIPQGNGFIR